MSDETQPGDHVLWSVGEVLQMLEDAEGDHSLVLVHFYWEGCPLCGGGTPLTKALDRLTSLYGFRRADIAWRGNNDVNFKYDYRAPVQLTYKVCWEMLRTKTQRYNGNLPVESYAVPPWDRVHFPQLFFIDGASIDRDAIGKLKTWNNEPSDGTSSPTLPGLFNERWEIVLFEEDDAGNKSWEKQETLWNAIGDGLLLQLVNEHLDTVGDDQHPNIPALEESVRALVEQRVHAPQNPETCVRFQRAPIQPPS